MKKNSAFLIGSGGFLFLLPAEKLKAMLTSILRIVALPYYEAGGCLCEFLAEAFWCFTLGECIDGCAPFF